MLKEAEMARQGTSRQIGNNDGKTREEKRKEAAAYIEQRCREAGNTIQNCNNNISMYQNRINNLEEKKERLNNAWIELGTYRDCLMASRGTLFDISENQAGLWFGDRKDDYNNYADDVVYEQYNLYLDNVDEIMDEIAAEMQNMDSLIDEYNQNIASERTRINRAMLTLQ